jgi:hypothetical protein
VFPVLLNQNDSYSSGSLTVPTISITISVFSHKHLIVIALGTESGLMVFIVLNPIINPRAKPNRKEILEQTRSVD